MPQARLTANQAATKMKRKAGSDHDLAELRDTKKRLKRAGYGEEAHRGQWQEEDEDESKDEDNGEEGEDEDESKDEDNGEAEGKDDSDDDGEENDNGSEEDEDSAKSGEKDENGGEDEEKYEAIKEDMEKKTKGKSRMKRQNVKEQWGGLKPCWRCVKDKLQCERGLNACRQCAQRKLRCGGQPKGIVGSAEDSGNSGGSGFNTDDEKTIERILGLVKLLKQKFEEQHRRVLDIGAWSISIADAVGVTLQDIEHWVKTHPAYQLDSDDD